MGTDTRVIGTVARSDLERLYPTDRASEPVSAIIEPRFVHAHPDHTLDIVLERLHESDGLLPIVSRADAQCLEGVVTPESMLRQSPPPSRP